MPRRILLNSQIYQPPEMMNQRVYYFHGLGLSYFCSLKALPWIIADYLQWAIYIKTKIRVYMCIKNKLA